MKDFFAKNKTVVITVVVILILLMLFYVFKDDIKALFSKDESNSDVKVNTDTNTTTTSEPNIETTSVIGKSAYANQNAVAVLFKADASNYRTKSKDEFVGVIKGSTTLGGSAFYTLGTGDLVVSKNKVYTK